MVYCFNIISGFKEMNSALNQKTDFYPVGHSSFHVDFYWVLWKLFFYSPHWRVNCLQTKFQLDPSWFGLLFKRFMKTAFSGFQISGPAISKIILILKCLYMEIQNVFFKSVKCVRFLDLSVTEQKWFWKNWISFDPSKL